MRKEEKKMYKIKKKKLRKFSFIIEVDGEEEQNEEVEGEE